MKTQDRINWSLLNDYLGRDPNKSPKEVKMQSVRELVPALALTPALEHTRAEAKPALKGYQRVATMLSTAWQWIEARQGRRSNNRRLEVATTVSLGEKRFAAVIQIDGKQFLIGGGATNVALLAQLNSNESFSDLLKNTMSTASAEPVVRPIKNIAKLALKRAGVQA